MIFRAGILFLTAFLASVIPTLLHANEEEWTCPHCDCHRQALFSGNFSHGTAADTTLISGVPAGEEKSFLHEIHGRKFNITMPRLPPGKYKIVLGFAENYVSAPGGRLFDIESGGTKLFENLDIYARAGGKGRALLLSSDIDFPGDALRGPLTISFIARVNDAKLNTLEVREAGGRALVKLAASDLKADDAEARVVPKVKGPVIWKDPAQPIEKRVADLVSRMSLSEKARQMNNSAAALPRLGLPAYDYWNECLHGVARAGIATVFPQATGMAASWNPELMEKIGDTIATEARAKYNDYVSGHQGDCARYFGLTFWTPNVNIYRDPRWGRGQETYGEDPFLTGRLGVSFVRGLQGNDPKYLKAMGCAKHFAVHSGPESLRHHFDVRPSERDLYETYLPQFEAVVKEGRVGSVMGAYNSLYGVPCCASKLLLDRILRKEWGFQGQVVSDCGAITDIFKNHKFLPSEEAAAAAAVRAGNDLCCGEDYVHLIRAVKQGLITREEIDTALGRVLAARFQLGLFDPPELVPYARIPLTEIDTPENEALALKAARESVVLLKNDGLLPLDPSRVQRIAVIGPNADAKDVLLGNYSGKPARPVTILEGIRQVAGPNAEILYETGCPLALKQNESVDESRMAKAVELSRSSDIVIFAGGLSPRLEGEEMKVPYAGFEGGDRTCIELPAPQEELLRRIAAAGKPVVFVNCSGGAVAFPWVAGNIPAIVQAWYPGEQGGRAVADVLFGRVNPSGHLPVTFYRGTSDLPPFEDYSMMNRTYRYFAGQPQYPFGHGLSYTTFGYSDLKVEMQDENWVVNLRLRNTGRMAGAEVVQVYVTPPDSLADRPVSELKGFCKVFLDPGEEREIRIPLDKRAFEHRDAASHAWKVEPGVYAIGVGSSSRDLRVKTTVTR